MVRHLIVVVLAALVASVYSQAYYPMTFFNRNNWDRYEHQRHQEADRPRQYYEPASSYQMDTEPSNYRIQYQIPEKNNKPLPSFYRRQENKPSIAALPSYRPTYHETKEYRPTPSVITTRRPAAIPAYNKPVIDHHPVAYRPHKLVLAEEDVDEEYYTDDYSYASETKNTIFPIDVERSARLGSGQGILDYVSALSTARVYH